MRGITRTTTVLLLVILVGIASVKGKNGFDMARGKLVARLDDPETGGDVGPPRNHPPSAASALLG